MKKKPTVELNNEKYYAHIMGVVLNAEAEVYMMWFKEEGNELYQKWKVKKFRLNK